MTHLMSRIQAGRRVLDALDAAMFSRARGIPARPAVLGVLWTSSAERLDGKALDTALRSVLPDIRQAIYCAPGREIEMRALWREAIASAFLAIQLARRQGISAAAAGIGGLLHRAGDALALQALDATEREYGARADGSVRARLIALHEPTFTAGLVHAWQLPAMSAAAIVGWRRHGERAAETPESKAVYVAHLLAAELLLPGFCAPELTSAVATRSGTSATDLQALRAQMGVLRTLCAES